MHYLKPPAERTLLLSGTQQLLTFVKLAENPYSRPPNPISFSALPR